MTPKDVVTETQKSPVSENPAAVNVFIASHKNLSALYMHN